MIELPREGRTGPPPAFPLANPTEEELAIWVSLWKLPQAAAWERFGGYERSVARYVRRLTEAERPGSQMPTNAECRQLEDRLGLSPLALLKLRWTIAADEIAEAREQTESVRPKAVESVVERSG